MRKLGAFGVILVLLGSTGFFFGWVQLMVPLGAYGVMRSKTHGVDPRIIRAGEFRWVWYKLIPTNVEIRFFTPRKMERSLKSQESLPSGREYASFAGFTLDFSYQLTADLSFTIKPEALVDLFASQEISDQAGLETFEETLADHIVGFAQQRLQLYTTESQKIEEILHSGSLAQLAQDVGETFPSIDNFACFIYTIDFPDFTLYQEFRDLYQEYVEQIRDSIRGENVTSPETWIAAQIRLDELAKYGELLTKYPILLQYLALEKELTP